MGFSDFWLQFNKDSKKHLQNLFKDDTFYMQKTILEQFDPKLICKHYYQEYSSCDVYKKVVRI